MNKVYIILLNYNGWRDTQECLESLLKLDYPNYQIVVVDNNSSNDSMSHLLAWAKGDELATVDNPALAHLSTPVSAKPVEYVFYDKESALKGGDAQLEAQYENPVVFIQSGINRGFAAGNNVAIEYALKKGGSDYIWCLNNDTVVEPNALTEYIGKAREYKARNQKVGIIGAKLMYYHQPELIQAIGGKYNKWLATSKHIGAFEKDTGQYDNEEIVKQISYPVGASMLVDIEFIKDNGLMCEDYFLYFEELDWVRRGFVNGWNVGYCWEAKVFHKEGASIQGGNLKNTSDIANYYGIRNRFVFTKRFYCGFYLFVRLTIILIILNRLLHFEFKAIRTALRAFLGSLRV